MCPSSCRREELQSICSYFHRRNSTDFDERTDGNRVSRRHRQGKCNCGDGAAVGVSATAFRRGGVAGVRRRRDPPSKRGSARSGAQP